MSSLGAFHLLAIILFFSIVRLFDISINENGVASIRKKKVK